MSETKKGMIMQTIMEWGRDEEAFAVALGLKRERLSSLRKEHLSEGIDWGRRRGGLPTTLGGKRR